MRLASCLRSGWASARRFVDQRKRPRLDGNHGSNGDSNSNNYIVGNCGPADCGAGEYRDHFEFLIPSLAGLRVVSADLVLSTFSALLDQSPTLDYQVTSLAAGADFNNLATFNLLGTGAFYGMRTYTAADVNLMRCPARRWAVDSSGNRSTLPLPW
jgi:hypothetical protein